MAGARLARSEHRPYSLSAKKGESLWGAGVRDLVAKQFTRVEDIVYVRRRPPAEGARSAAMREA